MPQNPRIRLRTSDLAWLKASKNARKLRFSGKPVKGKVFFTEIYSNPTAVPVSPVIGEKGKRVDFTIENVESIIRHSKQTISGGGFSFLYRGKVKFKGVPRPLTVAIKEYKYEHENMFTSLKEVIARLSKSGVPHPKMAYISAYNPKCYSTRSSFIVMEPFFESEKNSVKRIFSGKQYSSKLRFGDLVSQLDLTQEAHKKIFNQVLDHTAGLANAGLFLGQALGNLSLRADVFNAIKLSKGGHKVYVQDLDTLLLGKNQTFKDIKENWSKSVKVLFDTTSFSADGSRRIGTISEPISRQMVQEAAKRHGFV